MSKSAPRSGASKARLVITAIALENRAVAEVVADYGVSRSWVYELPRPPPHRGRRRAGTTVPKTTHLARTRHRRQLVELIVQIRKNLLDHGLDAGPGTIGWHLTHRHQTTVSRATISRILTRSGGRHTGSVQATEVLLHPVPRPRCPTRPGSPTSPTTGSLARRRPRPDIEIITWLDDHSRYALPRHRPPAGHRQDRPRPPSGKPLTCTDTPHPRSPTTAWSTPTRFAGHGRGGGQNAFEARAAPDSTSSRRTPGHQPPHHLRQGRDDSSRP